MQSSIQFIVKTGEVCLCVKQTMAWQSLLRDVLSLLCLSKHARFNEKNSVLSIFGSENMLAMEGLDKNWQWFYHNAIKKDANASDNIDALAVHGYNDGVAPSTGSALAEMWTNHREKFSESLNKPAWMTETSGYVDTWEGGGDRPGALGLALDIHAALYYGNIEAWVWWQGSENPDNTSIGEYSLMAGTTRGKKYYASKHFYRYIRPGAVRVDASSPYDDVFVTAYHHPERNTQTIVIINTASEEKELTVEGSDLPSTFHMYRSSASENCENVGDYTTGTSLIVPPGSLVTLASDDKLTGLTDKRHDQSPFRAEDVVIYPNPWKAGELTIRLKKAVNKTVDVSLFTASGALVQQRQSIAGNGMLKLQPSLEAGIYFVQLKIEDQKVTKLLSVQ